MRAHRYRPTFDRLDIRLVLDGGGALTAAEIAIQNGDLVGMLGGNFPIVIPPAPIDPCEAPMPPLYSPPTMSPSYPTGPLPPVYPTTPS